MRNFVWVLIWILYLFRDDIRAISETKDIHGDPKGLAILTFTGQGRNSPLAQVIPIHWMHVLSFSTLHPSTLKASV